MALSLILCAGGVLVALSGLLIVAISIRRFLFEQIRQWKIRRRFKPPPPTHKYQPILLLADNRKD